MEAIEHEGNGIDDGFQAHSGVVIAREEIRDDHARKTHGEKTIALRCDFVTQVATTASYYDHDHHQIQQRQH